ncbi:uncharacterized protein LOC132701390 [Cylas formicarius]|uniref:uncharacterized protein LOC132701390 n=1 Tax=Cylas formicarius TaxID=197179 RepID=UPI0029584ECF|nr:uncharacterized protein LOC132701390 [Cylas formicarius]
MRVFLVLLILGQIGVVVISKTISNTRHSNEKFSRICSAKATAIDEGIAQMILARLLKDEDIPLPTNFENSAFCFLKSSGFIADDGDINIKPFLNELNDEDMAVEVPKQCAVQNGSPTEKSGRFLSCLIRYYSKNLVKYLFMQR